MLEFLVALLVFSMGMMGLMSAQLAAKQLGYEASQRSMATTLAADILERIRTNAGQLDAYRAVDIGNKKHLFPPPSIDCDTSACTASQLAVFDLWQWESKLLGFSMQQAGAVSGGLASPRACISNDDRKVTVTISWLGPAVTEQVIKTTCGIEVVGDDESQSDTGGVNLQRNQLMISTYIVNP
jgi:type IV pilus assembly protein PilV